MNITEMEIYQRLGVAIGIGLLIGLERSWQTRDQEKARERNMMGIRTLGLTGLLGGLTGLLGLYYGNEILIPVTLSLGILLVSGYYLTSMRQGNSGATTEVASLITFLLALTAMSGLIRVAVMGTVVTVFLLGLKRQMHRFVEMIHEDEMLATLKLLLMTVVVLPVLPDRGFGPWEVWNPYELWWMVVLIAGISYSGYLGTRIAGPNTGVGVAGILGGLASSTALTLSFSRLARENRRLESLLAAGVVVACTTMFPRILIEVGVIYPALLRPLVLPALFISITGYFAAFGIWLHSRRSLEHRGQSSLKNPFDLVPALQFGLILGVILFLARFTESVFGGAGVYAVSAFSGISDVDAITLSLSRMARDGLDRMIAVNGIFIAASVNTLVKVGFVVFLAGGRMGLYVAVSMGLALLAGGFGLLTPDDWADSILSSLSVFAPE